MDSEPVAAATVISDSDSDVKPPSPEPMNADDLFNSLVEDREEEPKSMAADKKPAAVRKKLQYLYLEVFELLVAKKFKYIHIKDHLNMIKIIYNFYIINSIII